MTRTIEIVSPMWPSADAPNFGVFVANLATALEDAGFTVDVDAVIRGKQHSPGAKARAHFGLLAALSRSPTKRESTAIYLHAPSWFGPPVLALARLRRKGLVVHLHGSEVFPSSRLLGVARRLLPSLLRSADLVIVPSAYFAEVVRQMGVEERLIAVSPSGGVDRRLFHPRDQVEARRHIGLPVDRPVIGYVGTISPEKGWDTYLRVLRELLSRGRPVAGLMIGDGTERAQADDLVRSLDLAPHVRRLGLLPQSELALAYAALDVLLFPSRRSAESLGLVPLEAMATGVTVVGSRAFAIPEYVEDCETGFLADMRSWQDFARCTERALDRSPSEVTRMRSGALARAARYDREAVSRELVRLLESVISRR